MARKRIIDPEFWSDQEVGFWSFEARLFYIGLWNFSDDSGRMKAHPALLKSQIFPYDLKIDIERLKKEISDKVQWYEVTNCQYGFIRNFLKHQRIDKPTASKLPTPPKFVDYSTNTPGGLPPNISKEKLSKEKLSKENLSYADFEKSTLICWNSFCDKFPVLSKVKEISEKRRLFLKKRFESESFRNFNEIVLSIEKQPFLLGTNDRGWKVSFDWIIGNDTNYLKVLEMKYGGEKPVDLLTETQKRNIAKFNDWKKRHTENENAKINI